MKTLARILFVAAGVAVAIPVTNAADDATPAAKHPRVRALAARKAGHERIADKLGLSTEQTTQLKSIRTKTAAAVKAIRGDASLTTEQKKTKARDLIKSARTEMRGVLTPEQAKKVEHFRKRHRVV